MRTVFITGTDTNIGKTFVSSLLLQEFNALDLKTFALKPIASGCEENEGGSLHNEDALCLQAHSSLKRPYHIGNPFALREPIAPHIAASRANINLSVAIVKNAILSSLQQDADINLIEGVGGWSVPLNDKELFSEVISQLKIPVILVVGMKLGCLNHALLTYNNILATRSQLLGWVANCLTSDMASLAENINFLQKWIKQPCLGIVPYQCQSRGYINARMIHQLLLQ